MANLPISGGNLASLIKPSRQGCQRSIDVSQCFFTATALVFSASLMNLMNLSNMPFQASASNTMPGYGAVRRAAHGQSEVVQVGQRDAW